MVFEVVYRGLLGHEYRRYFASQQGAETWARQSVRGPATIGPAAGVLLPYACQIAQHDVPRWGLFLSRFHFERLLAHWSGGHYCYVPRDADPATANPADIIDHRTTLPHLASPPAGR